ncbi:MAG: hypothetical protein H6982_03415 [Chromatiales bacterium]|nr:hypothetical protein [Chromatiales bacterium]
MKMAEIGSSLRAVIERLFVIPSERDCAVALVSDAFANVTGDPERLICSVLRVSCGGRALDSYTGSGRIADLRGAIDLLRTDWRDLIVAARFESDLAAHREWVRNVLDGAP